MGVTQTSVAGLVTFGGVDVCASVRQSAYAEGLNAGQTIGHEQLLQCQQNPRACGITLGQVLETGGYGETEPNDNMIGANVLVGAVPFIGQSYGPSDQDWFYVVTTNPNQILTIDFTVPGRDPATQDVSGWIIQVTDSAGNVYARFSTDYNQGNPNGDDEITYPVTLGLVGAYYIVVTPVSKIVDGQKTVTNDTYSLAVVLQDSDINSLPVAVNFFDAEVEPNNAYTAANPLATGVTMYGLDQPKLRARRQGRGRRYGPVCTRRRRRLVCLPHGRERDHQSLVLQQGGLSGRRLVRGRLRCCRRCQSRHRRSDTTGRVQHGL